MVHDPTPTEGATNDSAVLKILLIDDSIEDRIILRRLLAKGTRRFAITEVDRIALAMDRFHEVRPDIVVLDQHLADGDGMDLLGHLSSANEPDPFSAFIMLTGTSSAARGVEAMRRGAHDYLLKGEIDGPELHRALDNAVAKARLNREIVRQRHALEAKNHQLENELQARRRAEQLLQESEALAQSILDSSGDCIKVLDLDARLLSMNGPGLKLMEIDEFEQFHGSDWLKNWAGIEQARIAVDTARAGGHGRFQGQCPTAKGNVRWWDVLISPLLDATGKPVNLVAVSRDITRSKEDEQRIRDAHDAAERANRAKDEFLANLSHELRTPLNPVLMLATDLAADTTLREDARDALRTIQRNISLEARLIDDLLDVTRITNDRLSLNKTICDIHSLLGYVFDTVRGDLQGKNHELIVALNAKRPYVVGDPARLQQIFWNVLRNGIKFTPQNGRITVASADSPSGNLVVRITDSGIGMSPKQLGRIFDRFDQGGRENQQTGGGLGLGLAIASKLADLHGGLIRAESEGIGAGSTFTIELPALAEGPQNFAISPVPTGVAPREVKPLNLLLVEDHEATIQVLHRLLSREGHNVTTATSVASAMEAANNKTFDLVLSDLGLPDGTGVQLMGQLRDRYGLRGVALSGYGMEEDVRRSQDAGFVAHLVKPVDFKKLLETLETLSKRVDG